MLGIFSCQAKQPKENMKIEGKKLVVYFSRTGENYNVGVIEKGNTHIIADMIADATGADRFEIEPVTRYPRNYNDIFFFLFFWSVSHKSLVPISLQEAPKLNLTLESVSNRDVLLFSNCEGKPAAIIRFA